MGVTFCNKEHGGARNYSLFGPLHDSALQAAAVWHVVDGGVAVEAEHVDDTDSGEAKDRDGRGGVVDVDDLALA